MARLSRNPKIWLAGFLLWFGVLWLLSSSSLKGTYTPPINHFDKVEHFGYFFGGSGLLSAFLFRLNPDRPNWKAIFAGVLITIALVAWLDEYHQTFTPGRSGNDPFDWLADVLGASAGAFTFKRIHQRIQ